MKKHAWKNTALWIAFPEAIGIISGFLGREGMKLYEAEAVKPSLTPPGIFFPIVWTILYAIMGIGAERFYRDASGSERLKGIGVYLLQLFFNFFWTIIFFNFSAYGFAFIWIMILWALIIAMAAIFYRTDKLAGLLQLPYIIWVTFAAYLNLASWLLNG